MMVGTAQMINKCINGRYIYGHIQNGKSNQW